MNKYPNLNKIANTSGTTQQQAAQILASLLATGIGGAYTGAHLGPIGLFTSPKGHRFGEGLGRGVTTGAMTGGGAGMGLTLGAMGAQSLGVTHPFLAMLLMGLGGVGGGVGGFKLSRPLLGTPSWKKDKEKSDKD